MIKPLIFLSLYAVAGLGGWGAYSFISKEDSSLESLSKIAYQLQPSIGTHYPLLKQSSSSKNIIYRWKDYQGNWTYEDKAYSEINFQNYEDELKFLQKLKNKQEALSLPSHLPNTDISATESALPMIGIIKKLFSDAKNIQNLVNEREKQIDEIAQQ